MTETVIVITINYLPNIQEMTQCWCYLCLLETWKKCFFLIVFQDPYSITNKSFCLQEADAYWENTT